MGFFSTKEIFKRELVDVSIYIHYSPKGTLQHLKITFLQAAWKHSSPHFSTWEVAQLTNDLEDPPFLKFTEFTQSLNCITKRQQLLLGAVNPVNTTVKDWEH